MRFGTSIQGWLRDRAYILVVYCVQATFAPILIVRAFGKDVIRRRIGKDCLVGIFAFGSGEQPIGGRLLPFVTCCPAGCRYFEWTTAGLILRRTANTLFDGRKWLIETGTVSQCHQGV